MGTFIGVIGVLAGGLMIVMGLGLGQPGLVGAGVVVALLALMSSSLLSHVATITKTERELLEEVRGLRHDLAQRA